MCDPYCYPKDGSDLEWDQLIEEPEEIRTNEELLSMVCDDLCKFPSLASISSQKLEQICGHCPLKEIEKRMEEQK